MKTEKNYWDFIVPILLVLICVVPIVSALFIKPDDGKKPPTPPVVVTNKSMVYNDLQIEWLDGTTQSQKTALLNGRTEAEYFNGIKNNIASSMAAYSLQFTSATAVTVTTSQGSDNATYSVSGNVITITGSTGQNFTCTYQNSVLTMHIPANTYSNYGVKVKVTFNEGIIPPPPQDAQLADKSFIFNDALVEWIDGITPSQKTESFNYLEVANEAEFFAETKELYSAMAGYFADSIEFISENQAKLTSMLGSETYAYSVSGNQVSITADGETLTCTYENSVLTMPMPEDEFTPYLHVKISLVYIEGEITPPIEGDVDLTGTKYYGSQVTIEWMEGLTQPEKDALMAETSPHVDEEGYFDIIKMGYYDFEYETTTLEFIDAETVILDRPDFNITINGTQTELSYIANETEVAMYMGSMLVYSAVYDENSLTINIQNAEKGVNISLHIVKETQTPPQDVQLTGKSFICSDVLVDWVDGITPEQKTSILAGKSEAEYLAYMKENLSYMFTGSSIEFISENQVELTTAQGTDNATYSVSGNQVSITADGETITCTYENSVLTTQTSDELAYLGVKLSLVYSEGASN